MAGVETTTTNFGLKKTRRGNKQDDVRSSDNMDTIDAALTALTAIDNSGVKVIKGALTAGLVNTFAFAVQNPESVKAHVLKIIVDIETAGGTATAVLDVDVVADATSTGDTIFDGIDANAVDILSSINVSDTGTNGNEKVHAWDAAGGTNDYITGKYLVEAASDIVGTYTILYTKAAS